MKKNRPCGGGLNISDIENCPTIITKRTPKKRSHYRYRIRYQQDAQKIVSLVNKRVQAGGYEGISESQAELILSLYPTE
ncbi:hypothetical protein [Photorhabdus namnaonensis]|uniref:Uncharacterized protein n=1 Tax=Photorhabdus namnaonensis TaxID=1851568 RepID=A0A1B8YN26_9GAMM|nr:hypothetical protein [Photorhabdus namnaonensis]OCA56558.1 hypothetical protein Phpb_00289 [Photorhabdus namnaonensis]